MSKKKPWTICPECGCKPGEYHKAGCLRRKPPGFVCEYVGPQPRNPGAETSYREFGIKREPLKPVTEECTLCGASTPRESST